jgi:hypothetical protein
MALQTCDLNCAAVQPCVCAWPDQPRRRGGRGLERLVGKEQDRGLQDREDQGDERRRQQAEFDGGRCLALRNETARQQRPQQPDCPR